MTKDRSNNAGGASPAGVAQRFGRFIRGDLWLVEGDRLLGLVRFRKVIASNEQQEMLAFDDSMEWEQQIRNWWLVGRGGLPGRDGGRLACAQCSKSLQVWEPGKLLGVDCVTRHKPPVDLADCRKISEQRWGAADCNGGVKPHSRKPRSAERETAEDEAAANVTLDRAMSMMREIAEAKRQRQFGTRHPNLQDKQRGRARYQAERERLTQEGTTRQTFVGQPDGRHEPIRSRNRHAQEQARTEQQARTRSSEQECLEQAQRSWADHWTPERARKAQARARELARQSSEDRIDD